MKKFIPAYRPAPFALMLLFLAACLFLCAGCSKKTEGAEESTREESDVLMVGFSQIGAESEWRIFNSKSIQAAAASEGVQLLFSNAEQKQENQIKAIRSFIMYQVDVICFVPIVTDGWDIVLREARDAGIPVLDCDRKIMTDDPSLFAGFIGTDSAEEGREAARFLQKKYAEKEGGVSILELRGTDGSSASEDRMKGFHEIIGADRKFSIVYSESGDFMRSKGKEIARDILRRASGRLYIDGVKVDAIFSANDGMTLGFLEALDEEGIKTGSDITVVTIDGQQEAMNLLLDGRINCVVECNPDQGRQIMELVKKLAAGKEIPRVTTAPVKSFSEFDSLSGIQPRGY